MDSEKFISVIIPNYNGGATIGKCLEAVFSSEYKNFEVVAVDDCSSDNSIEIIEKFPCKLIRLKARSGASAARNAGALNSKGEILFFTDADCVLQPDALSIVNKTVSENSGNVIIGGTYTRMPYDSSFFSIFQSVFVNYSETKNPDNPDYIATHAMALHREAFVKSGGFAEDFLPILEDVEFSHRLHRAGFKLIVNPGLTVRHIFNYSLRKSFRNAFKKTKYWIIYSLKNKDLLADSGTASAELKINGAVFLSNLILFMLWLLSGNTLLLAFIFGFFVFNIYINRTLFAAFYNTKGIVFSVFAAFYYTMLYPAAVWAGAFAGIGKYFLSRRADNKLL